MSKFGPNRNIGRTGVAVSVAIAVGGASLALANGKPSVSPERIAQAEASGVASVIGQRIVRAEASLVRNHPSAHVYNGSYGSSSNPGLEHQITIPRGNGSFYELSTAGPKGDSKQFTMVEISTGTDGLRLEQQAGSGQWEVTAPHPTNFTHEGGVAEPVVAPNQLHSIRVAASMLLSNFGAGNHLPGSTPPPTHGK